MLLRFWRTAPDGRPGPHRDFKNTVIVMTSNAGAVHAEKAALRWGFGSPTTRKDLRVHEGKRDGRAQADLPSGVFERGDEIIVFLPLEEGDILAIARLMLDAVVEAPCGARRGIGRGGERGGAFGQSGFDPQYGARTAAPGHPAYGGGFAERGTAERHHPPWASASGDREGEQLKFTP